jgi:hypothetical protein
MKNKLSVAYLLGSKCKPAYFKRILSGFGKTADAPSPKKSAAVIRLDDWRLSSRNRMRHAADHPAVERHIRNAGRTQVQERPALCVIDCGSIGRNAEAPAKTGRHASRFLNREQT